MAPRPTLTPDLAQLRVLSHPTRLEMLGLLRLEGPATASSLAVRMGLNSGATSYHLRRLAEAGLIEDDPDRGTKRDRWWRAAHLQTHTSSATFEGPEGAAVAAAYLGAVVERMTGTLRASMAERADLPPQWQDVLDDSDYGIRLTAQQAQRVRDRLHELLREVEEQAPALSESVPDTATVVFQLHTFPSPGQLPFAD